MKKFNEEQTQLVLDAYKIQTDMLKEYIKELERALQEYVDDYERGLLPLVSSKHHYEIFKQRLSQE